MIYPAIFRKSVPIKAKVEIAGKGDSGSPVHNGVKIMKMTVDKSDKKGRFNTILESIANATTPKLPERIESKSLICRMLTYL